MTDKTNVIDDDTDSRFRDRRWLVNELVKIIDHAYEKELTGYVVCATLLMVAYELNQRSAADKTVATEVALRLLAQTLASDDKDPASSSSENIVDEDSEIDIFEKIRLVH